MQSMASFVGIQRNRVPKISRDQGDQQLSGQGN
ncbi:hypothetical protein BFJ66_g15514 [Fusarium oxysporum f. sp. cepae]|nr:hypothetical protein BFJ67_g16194 [Fusarium oxysporum f. sp. cepae]RKK32130.1 hypothetical protein BFJ66_g15514 [Fusarium oxysporum f. sp. cepae]